MTSLTLILFLFLINYQCIDTKHFDGGTIRWEPVDPYDTTSPVLITVIQSYNWAYPMITCANNVPISTSGRSSQNINLTCVTDCDTDGGYSLKPIDMLTDCQSTSSSLSMMNSQRSKNISLTAGAHFYLANEGSAWVPLNDPAKSGLQWSIMTHIDIRLRPDGFINTPPIASVISPQYAVVNQTMSFTIPVSDANAGDEVRCRWATYTPGYRRRRNLAMHRNKRSCPWGCYNNLACTDPCCIGTTCSGSNCGQWWGCPSTTSTTTTTTTTASTTTITTTTSTRTTTSTSVTTTTTSITTAASTTTGSSTTTVDTLGTLRSTSTYPHRQAIDECGDICYPGSLPSGTTLTGCTISFTGLKANVWYGVAIQVEDFINSSSTEAMSSVPVQFLIYVRGPPACATPPVILPLNICLEVQVGVSIRFNMSAQHFCSASVSVLTDINLSNPVNGMNHSSLKNITIGGSLAYVNYQWTPNINQIGFHQVCFVAYTSEQVQSQTYCVIFIVKNTTDLCVTTTTTTTTTTSETTSTTSRTTSTSSTSTSTATTTTTSVTTTTSTTSTTSSTSTSTSTTSTTTTTTTTSTTTTSVTTTTITTTSTTTRTTTKSSSPTTHWLLILGLSLLGLLLALCCCCCWFYWFYFGAARRRRRRKNEHIYDKQYSLDSTIFKEKSILDVPCRSEISSKLDSTPNPFLDKSTFSYQSLNMCDSSNSFITRMTESSLISLNPSDSPEKTSAHACYSESFISPSTVSIKRIKKLSANQNKKTDLTSEESNENQSTTTDQTSQINPTRRLHRSITAKVRPYEKNPLKSTVSCRSAIFTFDSQNAKSNITGEVKVMKLPRKGSASKQQLDRKA